MRRVAWGKGSRASLLALAAGLTAVILTPAALQAQSVTYIGTQSTVASGLSEPAAVATDANGAVYYDAPSGRTTLIRVAPDGSRTTFQLGGVLRRAFGITVDPAGNAYYADSIRGEVLRIAPDGSITNVLTNVNPGGVALDSAGNLYISDITAKNVSKVTPAGVRTVVGTGFIFPMDLLVEASGGILVADSQRLYRVQPDGTKTVLENANVGGLAVDAAGTLYYSDRDSHLLIRRDAQGGHTTLMTNLQEPDGVAVDYAGNVYVAEYSGGRITALQTGAVNLGSANVCAAGQSSPSPCSQTMTMTFAAGAAVTTGPVRTLTEGVANVDFTMSGGTCQNATLAAGSTCSVNLVFAPRTPGLRRGAVQITDGSGAVLANAYVRGIATGPQALFGPPAESTFADLSFPNGLIVDPAGNLFATTGNNSVTKVTPAGAKSTVASGLYIPVGLALDGAGNLYVADRAQSRIVKVTPTGAQSVFASQVGPTGLAVDGTGNIYFADNGANSVVKIAQNGTRTTLASGLNQPYGLALQADGNLIVADSDNNRVLRISPAGVQSNIGNGIFGPRHVAVDPAGNVFVTTSFQLIRVAPNGTQTVLSSPARGSDIYGIAIDASGNLYFNLFLSGQLKKLTRSVPRSLDFPATPVNGVSAPQSVTVENTGNAALALNALTVDTNFERALIGASGDCAISGMLQPAGTCNLNISFKPTTSGALQSTAQLTSNSLNGNPATHTIPLSGTGEAATQTISFSGLPPSAVYGAAGPYTLTGTASSGLPVSYAVSGPATLTGSTLTITGAGTVSVTASQAGDASYKEATPVTLTIEVGKAPTSATLTPSTLTPTQGQPMLLSAAVTGAPAGASVTFQAGGATICSTVLNAGGATCGFTPSTAGSVTVTVQYAGDANYLASSAEVTLTVAEAYSAAIRLQVANTQLVYPGATNIVICVTRATATAPTGSMQLFDGSILLMTKQLGGDGCAYWYISPGLAAGTHTLKAVYSGDAKNPAGTSAPVTVTVDPVPVNMAVSCWNGTFPYGADYECTVNLSSTAGAVQGSFTYTYDGGSPVTLPIGGGNARFKIVKPVVGGHNVVIAYAQQTNYAAAGPKTQTFTVTPAPVNVALTPSSWYFKAGTTLSLQTAVTSPSAGTPAAIGSVSFYDGSTLLATVPVDSNGRASYATSTLPAGAHTLKATYADGANYASGSVTASITVAP